jgi:hypothetical protein
MVRFFLLFCICAIFLAIPPAANSDQDAPPESIPDRDTPKELTEAWLRFHEADLCQAVDTVFVFTKDGVELRSVIEDQKSYEKLEGLFAPLRNSWKIEMDATRPAEEPKSDDGHAEREPPASIWENHELRSFFGDPAARSKERQGFEDDPNFVPPSPDPLLKQRLLLFADQTLAWNKKMERYAKDIPALARVALDPAQPQNLRAKAMAVCEAHAKNLNKIVGKLFANLEHAFPSPQKKDRSARTEKPDVDLKTPLDRADNLAEFTRTVGQRVYQFIHPEHHSVGLDELRQPALLDSLKDLRKTAGDFQHALSKTKL